MLALDSSAVVVVVDHVEMPATEQQQEAEREGEKERKGERERRGDTLSEIRLTFSIKSRLAAASFDVAGCRDYSS